ncbi:TonB-dependent receptor [Flavobacterium sp. N2038]|uniref:TonB-dependent receptor n=1 Tax=Flavobacterium sp. N2038 TaxID=2986829 RepID=UPI002224101E|nr:TonB-dependent receptor [Flavobacterium sp. N2038]
MITKKKALIIVILITFLSFGQKKITLSGTISDFATKETLTGVGISIPALRINALTYVNGFYSIEIPKGEYQVEINYANYQPLEKTISVTANTKLNFLLKRIEQPEPEQLQEIIITANPAKANTRSPEMSVNKLTVSTIKKMPVVMGEVDVLKSILLLPGVTNAGEGASGFNVRGGGADQNLILLDEAIIFNSSHVFGFFSVFNADVLKDLKLYKGGVPARFGGRASSVLEVQQKDGNNQNINIDGGIGLIASRLLVEGPIVKSKGSFLIGGRSSYAHLFLKLSEEDKNKTAYFYDLNAKVTYKLDENDHLYISGYYGRDLFSINESFTNSYGNTTANFRWSHRFSDHLSSNLSLVYSNYFYGLDLDLVGFKWITGIQNYSLKYDFKNYVSDNYKLNYGLSGIYYLFNPGTLRPLNAESPINADQLDKKYAFEPALYLDAETKLSEKFTFSYGLRYSMFYRLGASTVNLYNDNNPLLYNSALQIYQKATPIATEYYAKNKLIYSYDNFEPRFSLGYQLNENQALKVSYNRMVQYLQLISNTSSPSPLDIWMPSDQYIKPQLADQIALGYFKNFNNGAYSLEVETYLKKIRNRLDYIDGANLLANNAIEQVILNGKMRSYGLEILFKKNLGKLNGWVSYTLSKSQQQTPGRTPQETGINNGQWYSSVYDKLHDLSITSSYNLNKKWSFGMNFALQSGQPVTYPNAQYDYLGIKIPSYGLRNENRLPAYHHLDISATLVPKQSRERSWKGEWVFSIYNLYNRHNAASINFRQNVDTGYNEAVKTYMFGIVPSVSYNFKFPSKKPNSTL